MALWLHERVDVHDFDFVDVCLPVFVDVFF